MDDLIDNRVLRYPLIRAFRHKNENLPKMTEEMNSWHSSYGNAQVLHIIPGTTIVI